MSGLFVTLAVLAFSGVATVFAEYSTATTAETSQQQPQPNDFDIGKYSETKQLSEQPLFLNRLFADEYEKRSMTRGFHSMRGKKKANDLLDDDYYYYNPNDKRAPMGFQGVRGKKANGDNDDYDKRAPMGFQGMRGKKNLEQVINELEKRAMLGFQGMRGKKTGEYETDAMPELSSYYDDRMMDDWHNDKRAPMGFQGMRGRKSYNDDMEKRVMLGFQGTRGKKELYEQPDEMVVPLVDTYMNKRPMMMGFHGMRGRRSADYYERYMDKRSPYRFFGSRGKKNPRWELRGKFVGVRGKKWSSQPPPRLDLLAKQLALPASSSLSSSSSYGLDDSIWH